MKITRVRFYDFSKKVDSKYIAKCSVTLDDSFILHNIELLNGKRGVYIIMPSKPSTRKNDSADLNNNREDLFHPVNKKYSDYMLEVILKGYEAFKEVGSQIYIP